MASGRDRRLDALEDRVGTLGESVATHGNGTSSLARFAKWADDPNGFIEHELGVPWEQFEHLAPLTELVRDRPFVVCRSCNGFGKDWLSARIALWWVYARRGFVLITGPTERQVREVVFAEVARAFGAAPQLPGKLYELALRLPANERAGLLGFTSTDASKLSGFHAPRLLVILTEAQGVESFAWEGVLSCSTGEDSRVLAVGNPLLASGRFFEVSRSAGWAAVKWAASDHPNVKTGRDVIPGAVTREFIKLMKSEYGEGSGVFSSRVLGEFPDSDDDALVKRAWLELAARKWESQAFEQIAASKAVRCAVDPARFGTDQTALAVVQGPVVREIVTWAHADTMETCGKVILALQERGLDPRSTAITCDEPGLGAGIIDRLRELGCRGVVSFNGGRTALRPDKFMNRRAETYWAVRRLLEEGKIAVPRDAKLWDELSGTRWHPNSRGQVQLESKDDLKLRLGRSPDRADAVSMALEARPLGGNFTPVRVKW
jgi:hypothetical protein